MSLTDFKSLKNTRKTALSDLATELSKTASGSGGSKDERFWKPTRDKAGNGFAIIRFLPAPPGESIPYVRVWDHYFKGPTGAIYAENSLTTLGQPDPVSELNGKLWNSGNESDKKQAREQKRKLNFISNIYVIKDTANPAAEGKNWLYKYGKKIFDKINDKANPAAEFEDESPQNIFCFWEGSNFRLKIRTVENYPNYDKSEFDSPSALFNGDEEALEKLWKNLYSLEDFLKPEHFKSYDELSTKLNKVLGLDQAPRTNTRSVESEAKSEAKASKSTPAPWEADGDNDEMEEHMKMLRKLAEDND